MKSSKYKALIVDVDGTLIPYTRNAVPSPKVTEAINRASKILHTGIATSRCYYASQHIIKHLNLSGPSILNGGAQIVDLSTLEHYYQQSLEQTDIFYISKVLKDYRLPFILCDGVNADILFDGKNFPEKTFFIYSQGLENTLAQKLVKTISHRPTISTFTTKSEILGKTDFLVTHARATKQHGIEEAAKALGISTKEIIAVGDGYNDFPLLMACGLKVAMGNAVYDLKAIADYIAPTVEEDGVADVIEKFIL
ncbi:MAG: HAD-IIB family hydrolase [Candidatus Levybacteria bacterium]|nr:HAD-IIB family hydrolase [Candidatus Levybacteria bacterium]